MKTKTRDNDEYVFVPSLNLYVAKERTLQGKNWSDSHKELQKQGSRMLTIPQFVELLKYLKSNPADYQALFEDITQVRVPWRAEWLDADFKLIDRKLYINSNHLYKNGNLVPKTSEVLDKNTLMKRSLPGISLDSWLKNPTSQGLPSKKVKSGSLFYWYPNEDSSVGGFCAYDDWAGLSCNGDSSFSHSCSRIAVRHE